MGTARVGKVVNLWRYPVKSMRGEAVGESHVAERGLIGDRALALVDADADGGRVGSAKHPRKWGVLLGFAATFASPPQPDCPLPPVRVTFPDGTVAMSDAPDIEARLSQVIGRTVRLARTPPPDPMIERLWPDVERLAPRAARERGQVAAEPGEVVTTSRIAGAAPEGTFFDYAPVHLLTTASLDRLASLNPGGRLAPERFRPNLVIAPDDAHADFPEDAWVGRSLIVGEALVLRVVAPTPRCVVTTLPQGELPHDLSILRGIADHHRIDLGGTGQYACLGVYAHVLRRGTICPGDVVRFAPEWYEETKSVPTSA